MKIKYVRQEKKIDARGQALRQNGIGPNKQSDGTAVFEPEIEEFFVYTPKPNYPNQMFGSGAKKSESVKIAKRFNRIL